MADVYCEVADKVGWIVFDRPQKLNALSANVLSEFESALDVMTRDSRVSVIVVRGEGRAFSVGYDVSGGEYGERKRALDDWLDLRSSVELWLKVWRCPKPVISAIQGYCMGGATMLAVCSDLTIVADDAVIGWPTIPLGGGLLSPVSAWLVGPKKAKEMSYVVGSRMTGVEAVEWGWANRAVPPGQLLDEAGALARRIAKTPPELLAIKKRALNRVMDIQGFSEAVMFGAEFDAIAHDSVAVEEIVKEIEADGLKATMARYAAD